MSDIVYLGGVDADALGLSLTGLPGAWSSPASPYDTLAVARYDGVRLRQPVPEIGPRQLELEGIIRADSAATTEVVRQTLRDAVADRLVSIRYGYQPAREYFGVLTALEAGLFAPGNLAGWATVRMTFLLPDPWAVDTVQSFATGGAGERVPVALGTGPTRCYVEVTGGASPYVLTYRDHAGQVLGTLTYSGPTLGAGDALVVDGTNGGDVWIRTGTTRTQALADVADGYAFPVFSARDGVRAVSSWPTVETSTGTVSVSYARRWA